MASVRALASLGLAITLTACGSDSRPPICAECYKFDASADDAGEAGALPGGFPLSGVGTPGKCDGFGSPMVQVDAPNASYCIDVYEATVQEYATFVKAAQNARLAAPCDGNTFDNGLTPPAVDPKFPAYHVSWCDAAGYCRYAGKRLCGSIERNPDAGFYSAGIFDVTTAATSSEWYYACSNGGTTAYPYGNTFVQTTCNAPTINIEPLAEVGQFTDCHGVTSPYDAIFDMAGNLEEWENNCVQAGSEPASTDLCTLRGGEYKILLDFDRTTECNFLNDRQQRRAKHDVAGIRCCKDL